MVEVAALADVGEKVTQRQEIPSREISDERFIGQLDQLRQLKQFLFEEKVRFKAEDLNIIDFGALNNLVYSTYGRVPSPTEWRLLDEKLSTLANYLSDDLRRKIRIRELSNFFKTLPLVFITVSGVLTIIYLMLGSLQKVTPDAFYNFLFYFIVIAWAISQGGLGACAFLGTSAILRSFQDIAAAGGSDVSKSRESIDITDRNFLAIRVVLGTLFALLLGVPFSGRALYELNLALSSIPSDATGTNQLHSDYTFLLFIVLPFIVGFSTSLVLTILTRSVAAIETFFGLSART